MSTSQPTVSCPLIRRGVLLLEVVLLDKSITVLYKTCVSHGTAISSEPVATYMVNVSVIVKSLITSPVGDILGLSWLLADARSSG